jgi:hypothetical protein
VRGWTVLSGGGTLPGMVDPRYAIPLAEFVAGAEVARAEQVEVQALPVVPAPAPGDPLRYADGTTGDADGD